MKLGFAMRSESTARVCGAEAGQGHGSADVLVMSKAMAHGGADARRRHWRGSRASMVARRLGSGAAA